MFVPRTSSQGSCFRTLSALAGTTVCPVMQLLSLGGWGVITAHTTCRCYLLPCLCQFRSGVFQHPALSVTKSQVSVERLYNDANAIYIKSIKVACLESGVAPMRSIESPFHGKQIVLLVFSDTVYVREL